LSRQSVGIDLDGGPDFGVFVNSIFYASNPPVKVFQFSADSKGHGNDTDEKRY
jgi:hypothetical protein